MRSTETSSNALVEIDTLSLQEGSLQFLMNEAVDRAAYDMAMKAIEPLAELDDIIKKGTAMRNTQVAIRKCIENVNKAITSKPDPILSALRLSDPQKKLVDAITACEVLKFSILNAMDAVRMNFITDFKRELKFYTDEAIVYNVMGTAPSLRLSNPQRAPFSKVKDLASYDVIHQGRSFMVVGPEVSGATGTVVLPVPGSGYGIPLRNVAPGKIYVVARNADGEPAPAQSGLKSLFLKISPPPTGRGILDDTISKIATDKGFDLKEIVRSNFKIPTPAEGMLVSIYRAMRKRPAVRPPELPADDFADDLEKIKLSDFKEYFEAIVQKTQGASGDVTTYDTADTLFFGGLASVSGMLGLSRPSAAPTGGGAGSSGRGGGAAGGGGGGGTSGAPVFSHSLRNVLSNPMIAAGSTPAERSANMAKITSALNQEELRSTLNRLTGGSVVFTEGTVDRWCELAGIKEGR